MNSDFQGERQLERGQDVSMWPWIKLRLARMRGDMLSAEIDLWNLEHPTALVPKLEDNNTKVLLEYGELSPPPLMQWSALFGSALSDLRAALDSLAWQVSHLDGKKPAKPTQLYFPIYDDGDTKRWQDWHKVVPDMSPDLFSRFQSVGRLQDRHVGKSLRILSRLNNVDKHRSALTLSPYSEQGNLSLSLDLGNPRSDTSRMRCRVLIAPDEPLQPGSPVLECAWEHAFTDLDCKASVELTPYIDIAEPGEAPDFRPAMLVIQMLHTHVMQVSEFICTGGGPQTHES